VARSVPVVLWIAAIGVSLMPSTLGLNANGTIQMTIKDPGPGWLRLGPSPGQDGFRGYLGQ